MKEDFHIRVSAAYGDGQTPNYARWIPNAAEPIDRRILHTVIIRCFQYLQTGDNRVWSQYFTAPDSGLLRMFVCVGNKHLGELGVCRQRQAVKQLAAKMRRLLRQKATAGA